MLFVRAVMISLLVVLSAPSVFAAEAKKKVSDFQEVGDDDEGSSKIDAAEKAAIAAAAAKPKTKDTEEILTGTVSVMRKNGLTEAFFKDLKESYFIPSSSQSYPIFKAFEASSKKGTKVTFKANKKSRQVISLEDAPPEVKPEVKSTGSQ